MIISMQGNWTVRVKSKSAAFSQRFVINGAVSGDGNHAGTTGTSVDVTGVQWSIAVQNNPGTGYQLSETKIKFPRMVAGNYEFEIWSNDAGSDSDFNDLILTCSTPVNINDFLIYGNVSLYSGRCLFNPCRRPGIFVIETEKALQEILKNARIRKLLEKAYPERIPDNLINPPPPGPRPFKPMVIDLHHEAMRPKTELVYKRIKSKDKKPRGKNILPEFSVGNFSLVDSVRREMSLDRIKFGKQKELAKVLDGLRFSRCNVEAAANTTLSFEEYDRSVAELAGGAYTGTGDRRALGDAVTDMFGNYIFRFSFDMTLPGVEDTTDIAPGESIDQVVFPDVIVKVTGFDPYEVLYESSPHYNIPNLKRIDLCLPESQIQPSSACFNGNLIGSLGNVFLAGNQNSSASTSETALIRDGNGNYLKHTGEITVESPLAGFTAKCAAWQGTIDLKGCMYDLAKTAAQNKIRWYTIRIRRVSSPGSGDWQFVSQNYKHPRFHKRNQPGYIGDDVGPFTTSLKVDGGPAADVPAYKNIQRETNVDGVDWEFSNLDRYMRLNTNLYDKVAGEITPGLFYVRVDCYDNNGNPVTNGTDMIPLFIHNKDLNFGLTKPEFTDTAIVNSGCGLYRLTDAQMNTPIRFSYMANDPAGFVDFFDLSISRCPAPMIALTVNQPSPGSVPAGPTPQPHPTTQPGKTTLFNGVSQSVKKTCLGFTGTSPVGENLITVEIQPDPVEGGWIKSAEYFTTLSLLLRANKRVTNGYNSGLSSVYIASAQILMERLNP